MRTLGAVFLLASVSLPAQPPASYPVLGRIVREDARLDEVLAPDAKVEVLASGFEWSEGPVWDQQNSAVLFSDIPRNSIMKWTAGKGIELFLKPSGYTGAAPYGREPGSNGLLFDRQGRLIMMEHGDRRVARMDRDGGKVTLVDRFEGKRLNSPNDGALRSDGSLYFTDPPYGLPQQANDARRELDFCGVYRYDGQRVTLLTKEMSRPNGIAFSPDEKTLYVANSDPKRAIWMAYPVHADGSIGAGKVFADVTSLVGPQLRGLPDGLKVARNGMLFATGPGGVHIYTAGGERLGRIETGEATANVGWGEDGSTLFITADMYLCRIRTKTKGAGW